MKPIDKLPSVYPENPHQEKRRIEVMEFIKSGEHLAELQRFGKTAESDRQFYLKAVRELRHKKLTDARIAIVTRQGRVIAENLRWEKERKEDETD